MYEPGADYVHELWDAAGEITSVRLTYVEVRAALAAARRARRVSARRLARAKVDLEERWSVVNVFELDEEVAVEAGEAAERYGLRSNDAVQLAAASRAASPFLSWDRELRAAAEEAGLAVVAI